MVLHAPSTHVLHPGLPPARPPYTVPTVPGVPTFPIHLQPTHITHIPHTHTIPVYNDAAFVLKWKLLNKDTGAATPDTKSYPVWESKCVSAASAGTNVSAGASLVPVVSAAWGKTITVDTPVLYDPINASQITYVCKGTTLDFSCKQGVAPPTAGNVTKAALRFLEGFTLGLGTEVRFEVYFVRRSVCVYVCGYECVCVCVRN